MSRLKQVESSNNFEKTLVDNGFKTLNNSNLKFTFADRTDLINRSQGNLFSSFNLPITDSQKALFETDGEYEGTMFEYFNKDKIIVVEIPKGEYGELIDGKTIKLTIPYLSGGTQYADLYSTFITNSKITNKTLSDPSEQSEEFGVRVLESNDYNSNIAYIFSDTISLPKSGKSTWASSNYKFLPNTASSKATATYTDVTLSGVDVPVGIAYLDKGFIVITDEFFVDNFAYNLGISSGYDGIPAGNPYSGGQEFTQIYFSGGTVECSYRSYSTEYVQNVVCLALPNEFYQSNNPTYDEAFVDEIDDDAKAVYITEVGLYNDAEELICYVKLPEPVKKTRASLAQFNIKIKL